MPHLTIQLAPGGPLVDILIGVSEARRAALVKANQSVPQHVPIRALIDTGASCTCIDPGALQSLGLAPTGVTPMHTPSTGNQAHNANQYDVSLVLLHPKLRLQIGTVAVVESELAIQGIQALIGRDVLANCLFIYDGETGIFTLGF
ncbi:MAG: retropepsin-like domain-containing protein [Acidobacteria bacterium]|nr:retropepsin-like domain-containing protein [Acidobacteriota bacterium]